MEARGCSRVCERKAEPGKVSGIRIYTSMGFLKYVFCFSVSGSKDKSGRDEICGRENRAKQSHMCVWFDSIAKMRGFGGK